MKQITTDKLKALLSEPESEHLDFKLEYTSNDALIKDILALANSRTSKKRRFLIFGVADNGTIVGLEKKQHRKKQREIIDLLHKVPINKMPKLKHYTLSADGHEVDILEIENTAEQPYFLKKDYEINLKKDNKTNERKLLTAGTFYERVGDTNRPIVDDTVLDAIYRQRFGLDKTPLERAMSYLVNTAGWEHDNDEKNRLYFYYTQHPEFSIQTYDYDNEYSAFNEPWTERLIDKTAFQQLWMLKYHSTMLKKLVAVWSDGGRRLNVCPERLFSENKNETYWAFYYIKGSCEYLINDLIQKNYHYKYSSKGTPLPINAFPTFSSKKQAEKAFEKNRSKYPYFKLKNGKYVSINCNKMYKTIILK